MVSSPVQVRELLEFVKLAVKCEDGLGQSLVGEVAQEISGDAAQCRGDGGDRGIAPGAIGPGQRHRQEQHIGRHQEHRAFDEGDDGQPELGGLAGRQRQGPVIKFAQHGSQSKEGLERR